MMPSLESTARAGRKVSAILLVIAAAGLGSACQRPARCATCGMKIDPASAWVGYVDIDGREVPFDTPRCALTAWRAAESRAKDARFREYYSQDLKHVGELRFVAGSNVVGPMGPDLVPIAADKASRFARDHNGAPPKSADELLRDGLP